jgi:Flp pilus assembly protein TadB
MTVFVIVAVLLWQTDSVALVLGVALVSRVPLLGVVALGGWLAWRRAKASGSVSPDDEATFLQHVTSELHGGASPRLALVRASAASASVDGRRLIRTIEFGLDDDRVAAELHRMLPLNGRRAGAALAVGSASGAPLGRIFSLLAQRAAERGRLVREQRVATAQARATAWLICGLPVGLLAVLGVSGQLGDTRAVPVLLAGIVLQGLGIGVVVVMLRASR